MQSSEFLQYFSIDVSLETIGRLQYIFISSCIHRSCIHTPSACVSSLRGLPSTVIL